MKKLGLGLLVAILALLVIGCTSLIPIKGSGVLVSEDRTPVNQFNEVSVDGVCDVRITYGAVCDVEVTADDNIYKYISISESNGELIIDLNTDGVNLNDFTFIVEVKMPTLLKLDLEGVNECDISGFTLNNDITINANGTNDIDSSSSSITGNLTLRTEGVNDVDLYGLLVTGNANVDIDGVETVRVDASGTISGSLDGVSTFRYRTGTLSGSFTSSSITCSIIQD